MKSPIGFLSLGTVSALLFATACAVNPSSGSSEPGTNTVSTVYVMQDNFNTFTSSILELPANGQGSVTPIASIDGPASTYFYALALDQAGNIYVGAETEVVNPNAVFEIFEYAAGATGAATPMRTINTSSGATSLAVDSAGQIYALSQAGIAVFAANATGNATPIRQIPALGTFTTLNYPFALAVDGGQDIYVADATNILVFSPTANGDVAPARTIAWPPALGGANGVAVDTSGNVYATTYNYNGCIPVGASCPDSSQVLKFPAGANGLVTPTNALSIPANPSFPKASTGAYGIAVDGSGSLYAVTSTGSDEGLGTPYILYATTLEVFSPGATSGSVPAQTITSPAWSDSYFGGVAVAGN